MMPLYDTRWRRSVPFTTKAAILPIPAKRNRPLGLSKTAMPTAAPRVGFAARWAASTNSTGVRLAGLGLLDHSYGLRLRLLTPSLAAPHSRHNGGSLARL